jgi:hypothetical protein
MHTFYFEILRRKFLLGDLSLNEKALFERFLMEIEVQIWVDLMRKSQMTGY